MEARLSGGFFLHFTNPDLQPAQTFIDSHINGICLARTSASPQLCCTKCASLWTSLTSPHIPASFFDADGLEWAKEWGGSGQGSERVRSLHRHPQVNTSRETCFQTASLMIFTWDSSRGDDLEIQQRPMGNLT